MAKKRKIEIPLLIIAMIGIWIFSLYPESPIRKLPCREKKFGMILIGEKYLDRRGRYLVVYKNWGPDYQIDEYERPEIHKGVCVQKKFVLLENEKKVEEMNSAVDELNYAGNFIPKDPYKCYVWRKSPEGETVQEKFEKMLEDYNKQ